MIHLQVEVQSTQGKIQQLVQANCQQAVMQDLLNIMAGQAWASGLFFPDEQPARMLSGYLLVLDGRMVQPWELDERPVKDGQKLKIVQVVPGG